MARRVAVVGIGQTKFEARRADKTFFQLAYEAFVAALHDAGQENSGVVDSLVVPTWNDIYSKQISPEDYVYDECGMNPKPGTRIAGGGATGGVGFRVGAMEVASGYSDVTCVVATEKVADLKRPEDRSGTGEILKVMAYIIDNNFSGGIGLTGFSAFALHIQRHMYEYGTTEEQMAKVSVKNHRNGLHNPFAHGGSNITVEDVMKSRMVATPYKLLDCCLYSEGACAVILASEDVVDKFPKKPVWLTGVGLGTAATRVGDRPVELRSGYPGYEAAARRAYKMAGITNPMMELDLAEVHDAFTGVEIMTYEALGFCDKGDGGKLIDRGVTEMAGELPVNPSGGLIGCGHPVAVTGVWQVAEAARQIRGEAGARQVDGARRVLTQNAGGPSMSNSTVFVFEG